MALPFWEIMYRSKNGPILEEKQFDLSLFKTAQQLIKKYGIKYNPAEPVDIEGDLADRVYQAGKELFLEVGAYCTTTKRAIKVSEAELQETIQSLPESVELGQDSDRVVMSHRDVEGTQDAIVVAGIQTAPYSNEEMMFKISRLCAMDRCVDGIWGGILLKIEGKYEVVAGAPSEIYQYRKTVEILRRSVTAAGRPGMIIINNAPSSIATIAMFDEQCGMRRTDYMEVTGMSELKVAYDDLNRTAFAMAYGVPIHGTHSSTIGGFSGNPEGAAIAAVAGGMQEVAIQKAETFRCGVTDSRVKSRVSRRSCGRPARQSKVSTATPGSSWTAALAIILRPVRARSSIFTKPRQASSCQPLWVLTPPKEPGSTSSAKLPTMARRWNRAGWVRSAKVLSA